MTKGSAWKQILFFSIPVLIGNVFQQLYSMVDTIIVGRYVGVKALAAVGATGAIFFLVVGFAQGLTSGFAIITAQKFGAGDEKQVRRSIAMSIVLSALFTVVLTALSVGGARWLLEMMNTPADIIEDAWTYIVIIFLGIFATVYYNMIASIIRAMGDSITPLLFLIFSSVINVVLDLVFITQFHMGVAGAGWATVISQLIAAVMCTIYSLYRFQVLHLKKEDWHMNKQYAKLHLKAGLPMALQFSVTALGVMVIQSALNAFGSTVIAAYTAGNKVDMLVAQPLNAFGTTAATFSGQNYGAGKIDRIRKGVRISMILCMVACVIGAVINIGFGKELTKLFVSGSQNKVIQYSGEYLFITSLFYPFLGILFVLRNTLQGMGESIVPMLGGAGELVARLVVALTLPKFLGFTGICLASPIAWMLAIVPLVWKYYKMMGKYKKNCSS